MQSPLWTNMLHEKHAVADMVALKNWGGTDVYPC